ncbi:MAG: GNAT family N-acetyltransferase [Tistlia sp.]|uniref:GNAT family N-acetyltransferase n=1 Tax=Tistlia sp. TaxID=3057121 RepID=UPI0034A3FA61
MTRLAFDCEPLVGEAYRRSGWDRLAGQAGSFFQTPLWVESWLDHRPPDSRIRLCRLGEPAAPRALALLGRRRVRLAGGLPLPLHSASLMESGDPAYDRLTVEFNAPLTADREALEAFLDRLVEATRGDYELLVARCRPELAERLRAAALRQGRGFRVYRRALGWLCDLPPATGGCYLDRLGRNTRQAVRRTRRRLEAEGPVVLEEAADAAQALAFFGELRRLHDRTWLARGDPGGFATPRLVAFHEQLIARGCPGSVQLLALRAGARALGYLYNFRHRDRVYQYQVGFDYPADGSLNLGLLAHVLAAEHYRSRGAAAYDLLAGDARYKRQLASRSYELLSCRVASAGLLGRL